MIFLSVRFRAINGFQYISKLSAYSILPVRIDNEIIILKAEADVALHGGTYHPIECLASQCPHPYLSALVLSNYRLVLVYEK